MQSRLILRIATPTPFFISFLGVLAISFLVFSESLFAASSVPFSDLPSNPLYKTFIETFQRENIIVGYTNAGIPTGEFGPKDHLKRSDFTKVAVLIRLLEEKQNQGDSAQYSGIGLSEFILKTDALLRPWYSSVPPAPKFTDVKDKELTCAKDQGGCEPWYTQYVNYAASKGMIKGYTTSYGTSYFDPSGSMLRIHALKLIMADNGNTSFQNDARYQRIASDPRIKNRVPRCLSGAEDEILLTNGGDNTDSRNLLAYALLADKLDLFGNRCQLFDENGATTPQKKAEFLHSPITRQEIARYFALTTTYNPIKVDLATDTTTDTKEEYIMPVGAIIRLKSEEKPGSELNDAEAIPVETATDELEPKRLNRPLADMSVSELTAIHKQGRCCLNTTTFSCKTIQYEDYLITEEPELGDFTDGTALWHKAERGNEVCFVPFADIVNKDRQCNISLAAESLIEQYTHFDYPLAVRQIWTSGHSLTFKMYMQIGLDFAVRNTRKLSRLKDYECDEYQNLFSMISSGHIIAELRFLPLSNNLFKNLINLL